MKITRLDTSTFKDVEIADEPDITLVTSKGVFRIHEEADGSLSINESSNYRLAVLPTATNDLKIMAIDRASFKTIPARPFTNAEYDAGRTAGDNL